MKYFKKTTLKSVNALCAVVLGTIFTTFDEILAKRGYHTEYYGKFHSPEHMARVYMNPPVEGRTGTDPIIHWEQIYVKYIKKKFPKQPLKLGELYETTFYGGTIPYRLDPPDRYYKYMPSGEIPESELSTKLSQADIHGVLDLPADYTITADQGKQAINTLERIKDERFVLTCSFHCPHVPITPSEPYASMYNAKDMITPVSIEDRRENMPYNPGKIISPYNEKDKVKYMIANYYAFVTEIDTWVGKILNKLDELKLTGSTIVIFVSDHGEMLGSNKERFKYQDKAEELRANLVVYNHVEHWINDTKAVVYNTNTGCFKQLIRLSKYNKLKNFGEQKQGHILLQGHGNEVSFRNIKITTW